MNGKSRGCQASPELTLQNSREPHTLTEYIAFRQPADLSFADHVHRLFSCFARLSRAQGSERLSKGCCCLTAPPVHWALRRAPNGNLPSEQEKAVTAKSAPVGLKKPLESRLNGASSVYASKIDGSAMGTARGEQREFRVDHDPVSTFAGLSSARPA